MTYERIFDLKFNKGVSTYELVRRYPEEIERVSEVALLDVPDYTLRQILPTQKDYRHLMNLKKKFFKNDQKNNIRAIWK